MAYGLTEKQRMILETIHRGGEGAGQIRLETLLKKLPYQTSKDSIQFSLRALDRAKFTRSTYGTFAGRRHRFISLTEDGYRVIKFLKQDWGVEL